jgi:hypothetical protein
VSEQWEARSAMRYGSKHERFFNSKDEAFAFAKGELEKNGNVGSIKAHGTVVYYDIYEEEA